MSLLRVMVRNLGRWLEEISLTERFIPIRVSITVSIHHLISINPMTRLFKMLKTQNLLITMLTIQFKAKNRLNRLLNCLLLMHGQGKIQQKLITNQQSPSPTHKTFKKTRTKERQKKPTPSNIVEKISKKTRLKKLDHLKKFNHSLSSFKSNQCVLKRKVHKSPSICQ